MKTGLALFFLVLFGGLVAGCQAACLKLRREQELGKAFIRMSGCVLIMDISYIAALLISTPIIRRVAFGIYVALAAWNVLFVLLFYILFLGYDRRYKTVLYALIPILIVDSISVLYNNAMDRGAIESKASLLDGKYITLRLYQLPITIHNSLCVFLAVLCLVILLNKLYRNNRFTAVRYLFLFIALSFLLLGEAIIMVGFFPLDMTILIFNLTVCAIYYAAFVYAEKGFLRYAMSLVPKEMEELLIILDEKDECIYLNPCAEQFFEENGLTREKINENVNRWIKKLGKKKNTAQNVALRHKKGTSYFRAFYNTLEDRRRGVTKEHQHMGSFVILLDRTKEYMHIEKEHYLATRDQLTGIYNMATFEETVENRLIEHPEKLYVMICTDIREFKLVNELFGKLSGDMLLIHIAEYIRLHATPDWVYCRVTGDHFAIFMEKDSYQEEEILHLFDSLKKVEDDENYNVHFYIGVYEIKDRNLPVSVMCDRANRAIHSIKGSLQRAAYYGEEMQRSAEQEQWLINSLPVALENGEIQLYLQPQTDVEGQLLGAEALVRWQHPERGLLPPSEFIPLFEENGMISMLDKHVWRLACEVLKKWDNGIWEDMSISVNISPVDIYFTDVYQTLTGLVEEYQLDVSRLRLEITETAVAKNPEEQMGLINALKKYGFCVEMDDFGSGYSSLNMLKDINIDIVKIDLAFLRKSSKPERAKTILSKIIELTGEIGMTVIVEGVETEEQKDFLADMGCEIFQGYFFAKPMSIAAFEQNYRGDDK